MLSKRADIIWQVVGGLLIAIMLYLGASHLYIKRLRAEGVALRARQESFRYSQALAQCQAKLKVKVPVKK